VEEKQDASDLVVFNASGRAPGPLAELDPATVEKAIAVSAFDGFLVTQLAARRMISKGSGAILLAGATASLKGFAQSAGFAMGKFTLRGLAQSAARELGLKVSTSPISSSTARYALLTAAIRPTAQIARSIRTRLPRPTSTCCASLGAPGP
jgi:NAD(P)-dependent dehydrogenase (short-subunit alcohol dehydrogenase family)